MQPQIAWKVVPPIVDGSGFDQTGRPARGRNVTFQLSTGQTGTVFISGDSFNADMVKAAIAAAAQVLTDVLNLTSDS